jgi:hypothetical protein
MEYMSNGQTGFLSTEETFDELDLQTCASIPQCSMPVYEIQGQVIATRTVTRTNFKNPAYRLAEAIECGAYGKRNANDDDQKVCSLDFAVAPLAWLVINNRVTMDANCAYAVGGVALLDTMSPLLGEDYFPDEKGLYKEFLSDLMNKVFLTGFSSISEYEERMQCAMYIHGALNPTDDTSLIYTMETSRETQTYTVETTQEEDDSILTNVLRSNSVLYHFTQYGMVEVAPMWWIKCHLLSGLKVSDTNEVPCPAWSRSRMTAQMGENV